MIPGVTITALNTNTGVTNIAVSNESGSFNIPALIPGMYRLTAMLPGFQSQAFSNIELGTNEQKRFNFTMQVSTVTTAVEVSVDASSLLNTNTATIGEVLSTQKVVDLPLVTGDVLDLVRIMPGVRGDSFAGLDANTVNTVRDGLSVTDGRYLNGIYASTTINPELVGEIRLILTPVDAELGRGNGQVQITTRSGTNRYTGTAVWNNRNTSLNANTWANNSNRGADGSWSPLRPDWANENQVTITYGGPIVKNKTFFFAQFDRQFRNQRSLITGTVLTEEARNGIFRFWEGWNPSNALANAPTSTGTTIAAVTLDGTPLAPFRAQGVAGGAYTGSLRCLSVFGTTKTDGSPFTASDCPGGTVLLPPSGAAWDPNRPVLDPTGYIRKYLQFMPHANYFGVGDGLNTAGIRWLRGNNAAQGGTVGNGTIELQTGQNINADRKQINIKIDQNFNANHKASVGYTYEISGGADLLGFWPGQLTGETQRRPTVLTTNFTSTLSSTLLNEFRFGLRRTTTQSLAAWDNSNKEIRDAAREFFLFGGKSLYSSDQTPMPLVFDPSLFGTDNAPFDTSGNPLGNNNPLYNFADTVRWTQGAHGLRVGAEIRLTNSNGYNSLPYPLPKLAGGAGNLTSAVTRILDQTQSAGAIPGLQTTAAGTARNLLYFMAGSIGSGSQGYWIDSPDDVENAHWEDYLTKERKYRNQVLNEWSAFFQDDWKVSRSLTLNLGLRYEYYGVPYLEGGFTSTAVGLGDGLFGVGRAADENLFSNWLRPGNIFLSGYGGTAAGLTSTTALRCLPGIQQSPALPVSTCDPTKLTQLEFVGPDTNQPDKGVYRNDTNNFGPVIGFAWQVPWFGEGRTTVRGGYQLTYGGSGRNGIALDGILGGAPGATHTAGLNLTGFTNPDGTPEYLDLTDLAKLVPIVPTQVPGGTFSIYGKTGSFTAYDPNWATPYTQNFNLSVTRNLTRSVTLDVRYVGTQGKKLSGTQNLNETNVFNNPELFQALQLAREGKESPLLDQMLAGINLNPGVAGANGVGNYTAVGTVSAGTAAAGGNPAIPGVLQTGAMHLRRWSYAPAGASVSSMLANGNFDGVAAALNSNGTGLTLAGIPAGLNTVGGRILRNGCDRLAIGAAIGQAPAGMVQTASGPVPLRCFPENFITANPQFSTPNYINNTGFSNYHSVQTQVTLRPTYGMSLTGTYTWSKTMSLASSGYTDFNNRDLDYGLSLQDRKHDFRLNGTFELPIGPNKFLLGNTSGWVARALERWQTSLIFNTASGGPASITGAQSLWNGSTPDIVGPLNLPEGKVEWGIPIDNAAPPRLGGSFFGSPSPFIKVEDPQCAAGGITDHVDAMGFNLRGNVSATSGNFVAICTNDALADASTGRILVQNALPGTRGTLGPNTVRTRGTWTLDGSMSKTFRVDESKSVQIRIDTTNMLNHPQPGGPTLGINSNTEFGRIAGGKTGNRTFRGTLRLSF